jgi:hypothetical protein
MTKNPEEGDEDFYGTTPDHQWEHDDTSDTEIMRNINSLLDSGTPHSY